MIEQSDAARRATETLPAGCVLLNEATLEEAFGWVFFYESAEYLTTGEISNRLAGNAPIAVFRDDGEVRVTGTAFPVAHYVAALREEWARRKR